MKRRQLILGSASAMALGGCIRIRRATSGESTTDSSLPRVEWRMTTSWPKSLDTIFGGAATICDRVAAMTDGRFKITPYAAGEIAPGLKVFDTVQKGSVECGHTASYYYIGKNPAFAFGTSVPFGLTAQQQNAWLYQGGGLDMMRQIYGDFGIINFPAGNTGAQMGGWFKRQVNSVNDLKGLKMRIPGLGGKVMERLGVNVQGLPGGEIYLALDRGVIDAAEFVGPYDDEKLGLHKTAKYYYYPGWWEPGPTLDVQVNKTAWAKLPKEYQAVFETAAYESNLTMMARYDTLNQAALGRLVAGGTQLTAYSKEILAAAQKAAFEIYDEDASQNAGFKQVYEQWTDFRKRVYNWNRVNELSFTDFAIGKQPIEAAFP
ncbi:TRAP transporter substrate-binding protein [filamentous cyanobacterium LEGE 11480]|uniref:TRAP transporter substrate-binding protein n=1 Tax=Romeriopsis navalis LEGE 11480 TaxID=2777977 RepID=A0A928Z5I9_9CYAN|nr:TRAP transporter substrate-binding protein [Romeriopsis navalis]MBE9032869.1 TRAP transporter substrate-binding protein [Romeriopsis navalis LEGE 11480]